MLATKGKLKICKRGHEFFKSSDCPVCPKCEKLKTPSGEFPKISAPANRALETAKIKNLVALANWTEKDLLKLHGIGPAALPPLRAALKKKGLSFK